MLKNNYVNKKLSQLNTQINCPKCIEKHGGKTFDEIVVVFKSRSI